MSELTFILAFWKLGLIGFELGLFCIKELICRGFSTDVEGRERRNQIAKCKMQNCGIPTLSGWVA